MDILINFNTTNPPSISLRDSHPMPISGVGYEFAKAILVDRAYRTIQKQISKTHKDIETIRLVQIKNLGLAGKNPKWVDNTLKIPQIVNCLTILFESIKLERELMVTNYSKKVMVMPMVKTKIKTIFSTMDFIPSLKKWYYQGKKSKCPKILNKKEKENIFKKWDGIKKYYFGLIKPDDILKITNVKNLCRHKILELTVEVNLRQYPIINSKTMKILNYMGTTGKSYKGSKYKYGLNVKGNFGLKDPHKKTVYSIIKEDR